MLTQEFLKHKIEKTCELQSIVKTMKSIAAANIRQFDQAVESLHDYNQTVEMALSTVLRGRGEGRLSLSKISSRKSSPVIGVILFGSDQGLCGRFNEQISRYCLNWLEESQPSKTLLFHGLGQKVTDLLKEKDYRLEKSYSVPSSLSGVTHRVQELLVEIEAWLSRTRDRVDQIYLFFNEHEKAASYHPQKVQLYPVDYERICQAEQDEFLSSRSIATFNIPTTKILSSLIRQYFFVLLYRALTESLACENASRLQSMQVAEKNIEERLEELNTQYRYERQSSITAELLDIVGGFEALRAEHKIEE